MLSSKYKRSRITALIFLIVFLFGNSIFASRDVKRIKSIEFRDLYYLSKYEIMNRVNVTVESDEIIIDLTSLRKALSEMEMVKSYNIIEEQGHLIIVVAEHEPEYLLIMKKGKKMIPFELDSQFKIISAGRAHALHAMYMPLIIVPEGQIKGGEISGKLKEFLKRLSDMKKEFSVLFSRISEIILTEKWETDIHLKGRKTDFIMKPDKDNFRKLNYTVGFFDRI